MNFSKASVEIKLSGLHMSHIGILSHVSQIIVKHTYLLSLVIHSNTLHLVPQISVVLHTAD